MGKLMEIIEKNPDFKNGTTSFKFLDTNFDQLARKIGSKAGANFTTVKAGDILSKELIQSLNNKQIVLKNKLLTWQNKMNTWINNNSIYGINADKFDYVFTSTIDYSSKYIPNKTLADYYLLSEIVNAEKELYEFAYYYSKNYMLELQNSLKEWSKTQRYWSCIKELTGDIYFGFEIHSKEVKDSAGLSVELGGDDRHIKYYIGNLQVIELDEERTVHIYARHTQLQAGHSTIWEANIYVKVKRLKLERELDDGCSYVTITSNSGKGFVTSISQASVHSYTGNYSPHFDADISELSYNWFNSRRILTY